MIYSIIHGLAIIIISKLYLELLTISEIFDFLIL